MAITVEYKRTRNILRQPDPATLRTLPSSRSRSRTIKPHPWNAHRDLKRNPEAVARDVVRRYPLIEDALDYVYKQMAKYHGWVEDTPYPTEGFWYLVYKWLRRHEDKIRNAPHLVGV